MYEIDAAISEAWKRVRPVVVADEGELAKRLARRRSRTFTRPPRDWCLVVRANDTRLAGKARLEPWWGEQKREAHRVWLTPQVALELNRAVHVDRYGLEPAELGKLLGCAAGSMRTMRHHGVVQSRYVRLLGNKRGLPAPILNAPGLLHPGRRLRQMPDEMWGSIALRVATQKILRKEVFPKNFAQRVERVAVYQEEEGSGFGVQGSGKKKYRYRVPPAPPDYVWYKWTKDGVYKPDKWELRRAVVAKQARERRARKKEEGRERGRKQLASEGPLTPALSHGRGSVKFRGWKWLCPGCGRGAERLYFPVHAVHALNLLDERDPRIGHPDAYAPPPQTFACHRCHGVRMFSRANPDAWNQLVGYMTAGMLYGREVKRPTWFAQRKRAYVPQRFRTSPKRDEVVECMARGMGFEAIARELGRTMLSVYQCALHVYRQHGVKSREELERKLGWPASVRSRRLGAVGPRRERLLAMLLGEESVPAIARGLGVSEPSIRSDVKWWCRKLGVKRRGELAGVVERDKGEIVEEDVRSNEIVSTGRMPVSR